MKPGQKNSYNSLKSVTINGKDYKYYSLLEAEKNGLNGISKLPKSLKVLLENLLRYEDDLSVTKNQIEAIKNWLKDKKSNKPNRVINYNHMESLCIFDNTRDNIKLTKNYNSVSLIEEKHGLNI